MNIPEYRVEERMVCGTTTALLVFETKDKAQQFFNLRVGNAKDAGTYAPHGRWRLLLLGPDSRRGA